MRENRPSWPLLLAVCTSWLFYTGCKSGEKTAQKGNAEPNSNPTTAYTAPGKLQFAAKSNLYEALAEFQGWNFTDIKRANPQNLNGLVAKIEINTNSVFEKTIRLTQDLKTEGYLDTKRYPKAFIKVYEVKMLAADSLYSAKMDIKIKDKKETLPFEFVHYRTAPDMVRGQVVLKRETYSVGMSMPSIESEVKVLFDTELKILGK